MQNRSEPPTVAGTSGRTCEELERALAKMAETLRQVQADALEQQAFLRNVIDTVPGFVVVKNTGGRFALANRAMAEAYGTTVDAIVGRSDYDFNPDEKEVAGFVEADEEVIAQRLTKHIPVEKFTGRDGRERWLQTTKVPIFERDGTCESLLAIALDITERRELEIELHQTQKLRAIGQLAGGIAHDFNNMLTCIMGSLDAIYAKFPEPPAAIAQELALIQQGAQSASRLTRELLTFSRKTPLRKATLDARVLIEQVANLLRRVLDKSIEIVTVPAAEPLLVDADATHLQNALLNLALNARDAMPSGGILKLDVRDRQLRAEDLTEGEGGIRPGEFVVLGVTDTGVGMDASTLGRVFEPFFTTKPIGSGTGLGLSSVYGTMRSHGGTVRVQSAPGSGSRFELLLPIARVEEQPPPVSPALPQKRAAGQRILVVDDEAGVRQVIGGALTRAGYRVTEAKDGVDALAAAARTGFDLLVLDIMMPGLNGYQIFTQLRARRHNAPALVCSAFSHEGIVEKLLKEPATALLSKPFREAELVRAVGELLARA